jgi:hypothetical protein
MFEYEHSSKHKVSPETRAQLVQEIEGDEFYLSPLQDKILLNTLEDIIRQNHGKSLKEIEGLMLSHNGQVPAEKLHEMFQDLSSFISTDPKLPDNDKNYIGSVVPEISVDDDRHKILSQIIKSSNKSETALLALYVYRDMDRISWVPFIKAAVERNPVCLLELEGKTVEEVNNILTCMYGHSIYDDNRLAQPDEVWNFQRGDGIEKALLLTDFILHKSKTDSVTIKIGNKNVDLNYKGKVFNFHTSKSFRKSIEISGKGYTVS